MTRRQIFARAAAYDADPTNSERHYRDLTTDQRGVFWGFVLRLRDGDHVREIAKDIKRHDEMRGVQVPRRRMIPQRVSVKPLSPMEADRLKRGFWGDQTASGTPLEWILP